MTPRLPLLAWPIAFAAGYALVYAALMQGVI